MTQTNDTLIDSHAHIVPETLVEEARKIGSTLGISVEDTDRGPALQFDGLPHLRPVGGLAQMGPRLEWLEKQELGMQIVASWLDIQGYTLTADHVATWARLFNEHLAQVITDNP